MIFQIKQRNRREQQKVRDISVAFSIVIVIFNFANVCWHSNQSLMCCFLIDRAMYQRTRE